MLELNRTYRWKDIVKEYPDKWVVLTSVNEKAGEIKTCKLLEVCSYEEKADIIVKYLDMGIKFECVRTTWRGPEDEALEELLKII